MLIPTQVNKTDYSLKVDDIQGSRTKVNQFVTTRKTDPLNPVYQISNVEYYPI